MLVKAQNDVISVYRYNMPSSRKRMLNLVSEVDTEEQLSKLRKLEIQGKFLEWTDVMHSDLTWRRLIFGMSDGELRFSLQAITNTTPTPDNLRRWGNSEIDSACSLCGQTCTLRHVLNACKVSLFQGRYLWRHNLILGCLQKYLLDFWSSVKKENCAATAPFIRLVPEGTKAINLPPLAKPGDLWCPMIFSDAETTGSFFSTWKPGWFSLRKLPPPHNDQTL